MASFSFKRIQQDRHYGSQSGICRRFRTRCQFGGIQGRPGRLDAIRIVRRDCVPQCSAGDLRIVRPVEHLTTLLWRAGIAAGIPVCWLALVLGIARLVVLAQRHIDSRAALVTELRARLERLLSGAASQAVRDAVSVGGRIPTVRSRCTLLYSDIRDFTSFSEAHEPEQVVSLVDQTMTIMVDAISRAGGDVDKMIGDAVLARFQGKSAERRAIAAAREGLRTIRSSPNFRVVSE